MPNGIWEKAYVCIRKDGGSTEIQEELQELLTQHCKKGFYEHREDEHEKIDLAHYQFWSEGTGQLHVYTLIDDYSDGLGVCVSILYNTEDLVFAGKTREAFTPQWLLDFIDKWDMVNKYGSMRPRPQGYKTFKGYLDEPYYPSRVAPFVTEGGRDQ